MAKKTEIEPEVMELEQETDTDDQDESTHDPEKAKELSDALDQAFGGKLQGNDDDADTEEEEEESSDSSAERLLLNPNEFKLLQIASEGDRKYQVAFTADDLNISTSRTFQAESTEKHPFETVLDQIAELILPLAFSDQKRGQLSMKRLKRVFKQNKKKEPIVEYVVTASNVGGKNAYNATSNAIQTSQLPKEFPPLFANLENFLREEISKKHPSNEQLGFEFSEEDEE